MGWAFIGLNLAGYLLFKLLPLVLAGVLSFAKWNIAASLDTLKFVGFDNFLRIFRDPVFWESFWNTILYAVVMVPDRKSVV